MQFGIVKFYDPSQGRGRVVLDSGHGVAVRRSAIQGEGFQYLAKGERVQLEQGWDEVRSQPIGLSVIPEQFECQGTVAVYHPERGFGLIQTDQGRVFVRYSAVLGEGRQVLEDGEEIFFNIEHDAKGPQATRVKRRDPRTPLHRFAVADTVRRGLPVLKLIAKPEMWDFPRDTPAKCEILRRYINRTFAEALQRGNVVTSASHACFNTGLVTIHDEEICGLFRSNPDAQASGVPWQLVGFFPISDRRLMAAISHLPKHNQYVTVKNAAQLFFDPKLELVLDYDHIIGDNLPRFPASLRQSPARARQALEEAVTLTKKRSQRRYDLAYAQVYRGEVQLLLPLWMTKTSNPDLALVVHQTGGRYRGETVLPIPVAYCNARVVTPISSTDWIVPKGE